MATQITRLSMSLPLASSLLALSAGSSIIQLRSAASGSRSDPEDGHEDYEALRKPPSRFELFLSFFLICFSPSRFEFARTQRGLIHNLLCESEFCRHELVGP